MYYRELEQKFDSTATKETVEGSQILDLLVSKINERLSMGTPVYFGLLPYYTDTPIWKKFSGAKVALTEEYDLKELILVQPIYVTLTVLDVSQVPLQQNDKWLKYHQECMNKLITDWKDRILETE